MKRKILVTSALPYANGPIHLGHLVEYIQSDIWCRYHKSCGNACWFICADDAHGTPIMISAQKRGITPEELVAQIKIEHEDDFKSFFIDFDHYSSTHTERNRKQVYEIYQKLIENELIDKKKVEQFYDLEKQIFLPDRFIKGICPRCKAEEQYGDGCEKCGSAYNPSDLEKPYSILSHSRPVLKESEHYFFKLSDPRCVSFLRHWVPQATPEEVENKVKEWLGEDGTQTQINDWNISRDKPYFGFPIPHCPDEKFFYVWLDAPIAYISTFSELQEQHSLRDLWNKQEEGEVYHFIGKDIIYFHALFWPALLEFSGKKTPTKIFAHGFLTINKEKMSKSRGNFVSAKDYRTKGLNPEWMRYYIAAHAGKSLKDIDLNREEFLTMINNQLIGKYINILGRVMGFAKKLGRQLYSHSQLSEDARKLEDAVGSASFEKIKALYEDREFSKVVRTVMAMADLVNRYIDDKKPWLIAKDASLSDSLLDCVSVTVRCFAILTAFLQPILPETARKVAGLLGIEQLNMQIILSMPQREIQVAVFDAQLMSRPQPEHDEIFPSAPKSA